MEEMPAHEGFFDQLDEPGRDALRSLGRRRVFPRGSALFNEGDHSDRVFIVTEGQVKISYFTDEGREVVLAIRGPGELLADLSALDGQPISATGTALEQAEVMVVAADDFRAFLEERPRAATILLQILAARLRDADRKRIEFSAFDSTGRVASRLIELAERFGQPTEWGTRINLPLSQDELAGWTGSSREAVSKALQHLRTRGWIETGRRSITIKNLDALEKRAT